MFHVENELVFMLATVIKLKPVARIRWLKVHVEKLHKQLLVFITVTDHIQKQTLKASQFPTKIAMLTTNKENFNKLGLKTKTGKQRNLKSILFRSKFKANHNENGLKSQQP